MNKNMLKRKKFGQGFVFIVVFAAAIAVIMLLWNWLIPGVIGWSTINYWQAAGLAILCRLLFGGIGGKFNPRDFRNAENRHHLHEKLKEMSFNERREFIRNRMADMRGFTREGYPQEENSHTHE